METLASRYQILKTLETNTKADIRLAHDQVLDRRVMVKLGRRDSDYYRDGLFEYEAQLAARLEHPHVLPVYDYGIHDEFWFMILRFYNETLYEYLKRAAGSLPLQAALDLARQIASAIDYIHAQQVTHGNLKPQWIVLDTENNQQIHPYISDFGVAAKGAGSEGRVAYTAPEQYSNAEITRRADLYAFGVILYECFSGRFVADDKSHLSRSPTDRQYKVRPVRPEVPIGVDLVIDRLTRVDPNERYATASNALEDLTHAFYSGQGALDGRVFISYARKDQDYVHKLAKQLRGVGVDLWIDQEIAPGMNWDQQIEAALNECDQMLLVFSSAALKSENVHDEWSYFLEQGKAVHIFVYQDCELPFRLRRRQYFLSKGDLLADVSQIVDVLAGGNPNRRNV